ncbi:FAD dependent oxidoreductase [Scleroderma citrinum]
MTEQEHSPKQLVVLGAGIIGLSVAYLATTRLDAAFKVTIVARDMPEDMDSQAWASPFAGANWSPMPMGGIDPRVRKWEQTTFDKFWDMIPTGLVKKLPSKIYSKTKGHISELWWTDLVREFRVLRPEEIPESYDAGVAFYTISVNPQEYIPWLQSQLIDHGVQFIRKQVRTVEELKSLVGNDGILVNASALGSKSIFGIEDPKLFPICGQTIIVQSSDLQEFLASTGEDTPKGQEEATYIIPRPGTSPPDTAILGGTFEQGKWDTSLDMNAARGIFERCAKLAPSLNDRDRTKILCHNAALRPAREGGPRLEAEVIQFPLRGGNHDLAPHDASSSEGGTMQVVHAYGFGASGYQSSWGVAEDVIALIKDVL